MWVQSEEDDSVELARFLVSSLTILPRFGARYSCPTMQTSQSKSTNSLDLSTTDPSILTVRSLPCSAFAPPFCVLGCGSVDALALVPWPAGSQLAPFQSSASRWRRV